MTPKLTPQITHMMSALLGLPDKLYPLVAKPRSLRFFQSGWGDEQRCDAAQKHLLD